MYYLEAGYSKHSRLRNAVIVAIAFHIALLLSISFDSNSSNYETPQIEVTLATRPSQQSPDEAKHISQTNQDGSGEEAELAELTSPNTEMLSHGDPGPQALLQPQEAIAELERDALTTAALAEREISEEEVEEEQLPLMGINPEVDKLTQELANLEAELDREARNYAQMPRVRRLTSVSAKQSVDAAYLLDWQRRAEAVGNRYYPEASVRYGLYGSLRLLAVIRADGSLEDIRVLSSSGYAVLDEAAVKTVRMAAPYAPFPAELRATTDKLEIVRTWTYGDNGLSSR
ncbi:MAG: energy transducer TonB [Pseudomonadota bacterium]